MATLPGGAFDASAVLPMGDAAITLTFGGNRSHFRWTDARALTWDGLAALLSSVTVGPKDGPCYTPATFSSGQRRKDQAVRIDVVVLDSDTGQPLEMIEAAVRQRGWRAIIHTTHSHLTTRTQLAASAYDEWQQKTGKDEPAYMAMLGYDPAVCQGAQIVDETSVENNGRRVRYYLFEHGPCPKFRVVLPLDRPWIAADYASQDAANAAWKQRIGALAHALGLHHDQSCVDTSRLFYLPRVKSQAAQEDFLFRAIDGDLCELWSLPDAPAPGAMGSLFDAPAAKAQTAGVRGDHILAHDADGEVVDLTAWAKQYSLRFEAVKAIRARAPQAIGDRKSGVKWHIECPSVDQHVTDQTTRTGTFVVNASEIGRAGLPSITSGFTIHCGHSGCANTDRLGHLAAALRRGWLSVADLTAPEFLTEGIPAIDASALLDGPAADKRVKGRSITPEFYTDLPGAMGAIHDYITTTSTKPQPILALGSTMALMAAAIGRKTKLDRWGLRPNVYIVGIAHSGAGKERPISGVKQITRAAGLFEKLVGVEEVASDAGIITAVHKQPAQVMLLDEVGYLLSAANNAKSGPHIQNVIGTLLKLYSSSATIYKGKSYAEGDKQKIIDQPCVSLYGATTPAGLFDSLTSRDVHNGLLSRVVLFNAGDHDPLGQAPGQMEVPEELIDWLRAWDAVPLNSNPLAMTAGQPDLDPLTVSMTDEAQKIVTEFMAEMHYAKIEARKNGTDSLYVRAGENALKFAMIRACASLPVVVDGVPQVDTSTLIVDGSSMRWACDLSRVTIASMETGAKEEIADTGFEQQIKRLRTVIRAKKAQGMTSSEMKRCAAGRLPERTFEDVLRALTEAKDVFYFNNVNEGKPGRPRSAYVHSDFVADKFKQDDNDDAE